MLLVIDLLSNMDIATNPTVKDEAWGGVCYVVSDVTHLSNVQYEDRTLFLKKMIPLQKDVRLMPITHCKVCHYQCTQKKNVPPWLWF